jgi:hypothetical protein
MPLITDYHQVKDTYQEAAEMGVALPVFCTEDRETLEAILASALELGKEFGVADLPIIPAWTSRYPGRGQMTLVHRTISSLPYSPFSGGGAEAFGDERFDSLGSPR